VPRKNQPGQHTYLLTGIPLDLWTRAVQKALRAHASKCGERVSFERCPRHNMRVILLKRLQDWADKPERSELQHDH